MIPSIYTWLSSDPTVAGIVGTQIFPDVIPPSKTAPAVVYSVIAGGSENYLGATPSVDNVIVQIACWATSALNANNLYKAVRAVMDAQGMCTGFHGTSFDKETNLIAVLVDYSIWAPR